MNKISKVMSISLVVNLFLSIFKILFGVVGSSGALIADGIHSLSDTFTDVFALIGNKISNKPADSKHPFGHGNAEYLTCTVIGIVVFALGVSIIVNAVTTESTIPSLYVAVISFSTIILKLLLSKFILHKGKEYNSNLLTTSGKESFSDVISSFVVLIAILISQLGGIFAYCDSIAMIVVGALIIKIAYDILSLNISGLLGEQVEDSVLKDKFSLIINKYNEVKKIDKLIILKIGSFYKIDLEISMDGSISLNKAHSLEDKIEKELKLDPRVIDVMIHVNPYEEV